MDIFLIIDTHQHLWDKSRFHLPWLKNRPSLDRCYLMNDYLEATKDLGKFPSGERKGLARGKIVKTIYMEGDLDPAQQQADGLLVWQQAAREFQLGQRRPVILTVRGDASQMIVGIRVVGAQGKGAAQQLHALGGLPVAIIQHTELVRGFGIGRGQAERMLQQADRFRIVVVQQLETS